MPGVTVPSDSTGESARSARSKHDLTLSSLTKTFGDLVAVDNIDLRVPGGEFLTLLGPSGSGKTTLLMMIAGFVKPSSGSILVDGRSITDLAPERRNFGMVFQGYALFPHMTVAENVAYGLRVRGIPRAEAETKLRAALALVRLEGLRDRYPRQLSGGQQQRVAIARALVFEPDILLFDEPLGALDRQLRTEVQVELKALHGRLGRTFVYVTHDQEEALSMSDRVLIFNRGRVVQSGAPDELYSRPRTRFVAEFLGSSNCLEGRVEGRERDAALIRIGDHRFVHADGQPLPEGATIMLALRPENISLSAAEPLETPNRIRGRVRHAAYHGPTSQVLVETPIGTVTVMRLAHQPSGGKPTQGEVWLSWPANASVHLHQ